MNSIVKDIIDQSVEVVTREYGFLDIDRYSEELAYAIIDKCCDLMIEEDEAEGMRMSEVLEQALCFEDTE